MPGTLRINQNNWKLGVNRNFLGGLIMVTFFPMHSDETPINCAELLDCGGLQIVIDCYEVNTRCYN